jgi:hypothetical protein
VTATERFIVLLATIIGAAGVLGTGLSFVLRGLWNVRGSWDATNNRLTLLVEKVTELVARKDADHSRIEGRADRLESRLERHELWHQDHP